MPYKNYKTPILLGGYHYVTSDFGMRDLDGDGIKEDNHRGIDVVGKNNTTDHIIAYDDGKVTYVRDNSPSAGTYVVVQHDGNLTTRYLHMKKGSRKVNTGDIVKKGDILGYMGNTGQSYGAHLHFDISRGGTKLNPNDYLFSGSGADTETDTTTPPEITKITQLSSTSVQVEGKTNGGTLHSAYTRCYYKWDNKGDVSTTNYFKYVDAKDDFTFTIDKPRKATGISILPVQVKSQKGSTSGKVMAQQLEASYPCVQIITPSKEIINATPYIYTDDGWKEATPTIRDKNIWYELYNTDKERVK